MKISSTYVGKNLKNWPLSHSLRHACPPNSTKRTGNYVFVGYKGYRNLLKKSFLYRQILMVEKEDINLIGATEDTK